MPQKPPQVRYHEVSAAEAGQRIDNLLLGQLKGVPRSHVYRLMSSGQVRRNGGRVKPGARLEAGDQIRIPPVRTGTPSEKRPPDDLLDRVAASIIEESGDYLVVDKPTGLAVHGGSSVAFGLVECLRRVRGDDIDLVHRLDRDTSGVLVCARGRGALGEARQALGTSESIKRYDVLVHGQWTAGDIRVDQALDTDHRQGGERFVVADDAGKRSVTDFALAEAGTLVSTVTATLRTGRTHQIRVHAALQDHPVIGDRRYGDVERDRAVGAKRLFLHAQALTLVHPDGRVLVDAQAPTPDSFAAMREAGR